MQTGKTLLILASAVAVMALVGVTPAVAEGNALARGQLYSTAAVNKICGTAQQIVTSTNLEVNNSIFSEWDGFVQSDAAPYSVVGGFPPLVYSPPEEPDLPLTSTQHVVYGFYGTGNRDFPQVVSCKMKSAAYLNATIQNLGAVDQPCGAVSEAMVNAVVDSLTNAEEAQIVMDPDGEVVVGDEFDFDPDITDTTGFGWTAGFPDNPYPVLYREVTGGPIHVKASALLVDPHPTGVIIGVCNPSFGQAGSFCEPRKWGVRYCHLPAPEYVRAAVTGEVDIPTCDNPQTADPRVCAP
jgi:hypothetical protein